MWEHFAKKFSNNSTEALETSQLQVGFSQEIDVVEFGEIITVGFFVESQPLGIAVLTVEEANPAVNNPTIAPPRLIRNHLLRTIWLTRPDLRAQVDQDPEYFAFWCLISGPTEYRSLAEHSGPFDSPLLELIPEQVDSFLPLTRLMKLIWQQRPDLQQAFDPSTTAGANALLGWFFTFGLIEYPLADTIDETQMRILMAPDPEQASVPRILKLLHKADSNLRARFPDPAAPTFHHWASSFEGQQAYPVLRRLTQLTIWSEQRHDPTPPVIHRAPKKLPFGVNLIGSAHGQFGIGEDVRMAAIACQAAGIPCCIYNIAPGAEVCQNDDSALALVSDQLPYAINLFCTTGIETARVAAIEGSRLFDGRRSIGYWPWELPEWPLDWHHAYELIDEVWASSRFAYHAYAASCPKPVHHLPMAVDVTPTAHQTRQDFGLPPESFLFIFAFDALSSFARKNPQACIAAFRRAFPRGDEPAGLVIKAMRAKAEHPLWQQLLAEEKADPRIRVLPQTLARPILLDLYRACDCYLSLHRSEGFGRGLAEAMLLGKPVIATGYSGNMDFTLPTTAALVDHRFVTLGVDDYPFGAGQQWAEPDVDHAAWWMQRLMADQAPRQALAKAGQRLIQETFSPVAVGARYRLILAKQVDYPEVSSLLQEVTATQESNTESCGFDRCAKDCKNQARMTTLSADLDAERHARDAERRQREACVKEKAECTRRIAQIEARHQERQKTNELLLLELRQLQQELEQSFLEHQEAEQQREEAEARWHRLQLRYPNLYDVGHLAVTHAGEPERAGKSKPTALNWQIQDLRAAGQTFPRIDVWTWLEGSQLHVTFAPNAADPARHHPLDDCHWPAADPSLCDWPLCDWECLRLLLILFADVLDNPSACALPEYIDRHCWRTALRQTQQALAPAASVLRFNHVSLEREQVNPDYEHLWLAMKPVAFNEHRWPRWELRLSCANLAPGHFGTHPKLEFPAMEHHNPLISWFAETHNAFGANHELRFEPNAMDINIWQEFADADQALITALIARLPAILDLLERDGTRISRPLSDWRRLVADIQRIHAPHGRLG
ncbi:glycosyltransferase [Rhabdochromatium marinum]|uniref:glycosyltransferase n=1 Tax=Rhabdochromatium marinum TaxID=48729 RepID=UPI001903CE2E